MTEQLAVVFDISYKNVHCVVKASHDKPNRNISAEWESAHRRVAALRYRSAVQEWKETVRVLEGWGWRVEILPYVVLPF